MAIDYARPAFDPDLAERLRKPAKGSAVLARKKARADDRQHEKDVKAEITRRDGAKVCRLDPNCPHVKAGIRVEGVHLDSKGMAGDHGVRTSPELMLRGCLIHHQGVRSIHSGHLRVKFLTDKGTNGPIALLRPEVEIQKGSRIQKTVWVEFAREAAVGVWETKRESSVGVPIKERAK